MTDMRWYKVRIVVPGTGGHCGLIWWDDTEQAPDEETAIRQADEKARKQWEEPNYYEPDVEGPSDKELGQECPVCAWAEAITDEEYEAWKKELEEME